MYVCVCGGEGEKGDIKYAMHIGVCVREIDGRLYMPEYTACLLGYDVCVRPQGGISSQYGPAASGTQKTFRSNN